MKSGLPPVNIKFTDKERYDCFTQYRENNGITSKLTRLVGEYAVYELKRYIEIAKQSDTLRSRNPSDFCAEQQ